MHNPVVFALIPLPRAGANASGEMSDIFDASDSNIMQPGSEEDELSEWLSEPG